MFIAKSVGEKKLKPVAIWQSRKVTSKNVVVSHFLCLLAVWWISAQSARDNHVLACNSAKYIHRLKKIHPQTQQ